MEKETKVLLRGVFTVIVRRATLNSSLWFLAHVLLLWRQHQLSTAGLKHTLHPTGKLKPCIASHHSWPTGPSLTDIFVTVALC